MSARHDIVYLSRVPWDNLYQRPQHVAMGLARSFRVLYVDTPRSTFARRFVRPLLDHRPLQPFLRQVAPGLTVLSPFYVPFLPRVWPPPGQYHLSRAFLSWAVGRLGMSTPILWTSDPRDLFFVDAVKPRLLSYDCMDDYALIAPSATARPLIRAWEETMLQRADVVFASAQDLAERCARHSRRVVLVRNGVDVEHVAAGRGLPVPDDLAVVPGPRIGYVGSIAPWVDFDLLGSIAAARPRWHIVLIGPTAPDCREQVAALSRHSNVHVLGERPYAVVPRYLHSLDVCLIPFRLNDLTRSVNPVKFYEYMAAGKPVVAARLPELEQYSTVCGLAEGEAEFVAQIEAALAIGAAQRALPVEQRLAVARDNSWQQRTEVIIETLMGA